MLMIAVPSLDYTISQISFTNEMLHGALSSPKLQAAYQKPLSTMHTGTWNTDIPYSLLKKYQKNSYMY